MPSPQSAARLIFVAILLFIAYATLVPIGLRPNSGHLHAERMLAFAALGCALSLGFPRALVRSIAMIVFLAILLEYLQEFIPTRDARLADALEKAFGGILGVGLGHALTGRLRRRDGAPRHVEKP